MQTGVKIFLLNDEIIFGSILPVSLRMLFLLNAQFVYNLLFFPQTFYFYTCPSGPNTENIWSAERYFPLKVRKYLLLTLFRTLSYPHYFLSSPFIPTDLNSVPLLSQYPKFGLGLFVWPYNFFPLQFLRGELKKYQPIFTLERQSPETQNHAEVLLWKREMDYCSRKFLVAVRVIEARLVSNRDVIFFLSI